MKKMNDNSISLRKTTPTKECFNINFFEGTAFLSLLKRKKETGQGLLRDLTALFGMSLLLDTLSLTEAAALLAVVFLAAGEVTVSSLSSSVSGELAIILFTAAGAVLGPALDDDEVPFSLAVIE